MKRLVIFSALLPPLALIVFVAPETLSHRAIPSYFWGGLLLGYTVALLPAWLLAVVDWLLLAKPFYFRILGTAGTAALMTTTTAHFMWDGFRELWPVVMAVLVGAIPAAVCSFLSGE